MRRVPVLLVVLATVGLGYWEVFLSEQVFLPPDASTITGQVRHCRANGLWGLGLGPMFSVLVLCGLIAVYHQRTGQRREEGRRFAAKLSETRLGKPMTLPPYGFVNGRGTFLNLLSRNAAGVFRHNTVISKVDRNSVHNTYEDHSVVREVKGPNHAFNGKGGIKAQPSSVELEASRGPHQGPTPAQVSHAQEAHDNHLAAHRAAHR